jgi:hypothetical protein
MHDCQQFGYTTSMKKKKNREIRIIILICDGVYLQEGWNGRKAARFSGANVVQSSEILLLGRKWLWSFLVDFFGKRPQTYSSGNFVRNNPYQGEEFLFLVFHVYLVGQTFINQRTFLPSWSVHFVFSKE